MRLWNKDLIVVLPRQQLVALWREISSIAGAIQKNGTPNHILVNKVLDYDYDHFISYAALVRAEMTRRGYRTMDSVWNKIVSLKPNYYQLDFKDIYPDWHNIRYLLQCYYNLQEKYDCGGIGEEDYKAINNMVQNKLNDYCSAEVFDTN